MRLVTNMCAIILTSFNPDHISWGEVDFNIIGRKLAEHIRENVLERDILGLLASRLCDRHQRILSCESER